MKRFWLSFYSAIVPDKSPVQVWVTGFSANEDTCTHCAVVDAESENDAFNLIGQAFPDWRYRFCEEKESDFVPNRERFPQ